MKQAKAKVKEIKLPKATRLRIRRKVKKHLKEQTEFYQRQVDDYNYCLPTYRQIARDCRKRDPNYKPPTPLARRTIKRYQKAIERSVKLHKNYLESDARFKIRMKRF